MSKYTYNDSEKCSIQLHCCFCETFSKSKSLFEKFANKTRIIAHDLLLTNQAEGCIRDKSFNHVTYEENLNEYFSVALRNFI